MVEELVFEGNLTWAGQPLEREFTYDRFERTTRLEFDGGAVVSSSAPAKYHGDGQLLNPETLMLGSLMQCHFLTFMAIASKSGARVVSYADRADGKLAMKEGKFRYVAATLRPKVRFENPADASRLEAFHHKAHANCFMSNSVNFPVTVEPDQA